MVFVKGLNLRSHRRECSPTVPWRSKIWGGRRSMEKKMSIGDKKGKTKRKESMEATRPNSAFSATAKVRSHSANLLPRKRLRSRIRDNCAPARCSTDNLVLCQDCDREDARVAFLVPSSHRRSRLDGFSGSPLCP
ncbi:hypothetical protein NL676_006239 [Syzygium grande]|nr:hypothetical protein NL676_006239 [Syzygium grande]